MEQMGTMQTPPTGKGNGPVIGIIIVIIVLAIGGYYLFAELQSQKAAQTTDEQEVTNIEGELQAEDLSGLEAGLDADLKELEQTQ